MFAECEQYGVNRQAAVYGPAGRQVIDVYAKCRAARLVQEQAKIRMAEMIDVVGPRLVSDHCTIDKRLDILDIASSSMPAEKKTIFEMHVEDCAKVKKFLIHDDSYHIEMMFNS